MKHSRPFETYLGYDLNGQHTGKQTPHDAQRYRSSLSVLVHDGADRVAEIAAFVLIGLAICFGVKRDDREPLSSNASMFPELDAYRKSLRKERA